MNLVTTEEFCIRPAQNRDLPALHAVIQRAYRGQDARAGWTHEADLLEEERITLDALGAILHECLTGVPPFFDRTDAAIYARLLAGEVAPLDAPAVVRYVESHRAEIVAARASPSHAEERPRGDDLVKFGLGERGPREDCAFFFAASLEVTAVA